MTYPVRPVVLPACLRGQANGRLGDDVLVDVPGLAGGPTIRLVAPAARAWRAMAAAALAAGHTLKATSALDSFRPYATQEAIFRKRYTTQRISGAPTRRWNGQVWYQRPGTAAAAVPGTSNHGLGLAVDTGTELDGDAGTESIDRATLDWLLANAERFGWSWELQSEPWHLRYFAGDNPPPAVNPAPPSSEEDLVPVLPNVKPVNGRWPAFDLDEVTDTSCIVLASGGAPFKAGLDKIAAPKFTYLPAGYGLSRLRVENLPGRPRLAPAPDGSVVIVTAGTLATFAISNPT